MRCIVLLSSHYLAILCCYYVLHACSCYTVCSRCICVWHTNVESRMARQIFEGPSSDVLASLLLLLLAHTNIYILCIKATRSCIIIFTFGSFRNRRQNYMTCLSRWNLGVWCQGSAYQVLSIISCVTSRRGMKICHCKGKGKEVNAWKMCMPWGKQTVQLKIPPSKFNVLERLGEA